MPSSTKRSITLASARLNVMLVHAGNPNTEYAAYLAAHYPNVYLPPRKR